MEVRFETNYVDEDFEFFEERANVLIERASRLHRQISMYIVMQAILAVLAYLTPVFSLPISVITIQGQAGIIVAYGTLLFVAALLALSKFERNAVEAEDLRLEFGQSFEQLTNRGIKINRRHSVMLKNLARVGELPFARSSNGVSIYFIISVALELVAVVAIATTGRIK